MDECEIINEGKTSVSITTASISITADTEDSNVDVYKLLKKIENMVYKYEEKRK